MTTTDGQGYPLWTIPPTWPSDAVRHAVCPTCDGPAEQRLVVVDRRGVGSWPIYGPGPILCPSCDRKAEPVPIPEPDLAAWSCQSCGARWLYPAELAEVDPNSHAHWRNGRRCQGDVAPDRHGGSRERHPSWNPAGWPTEPPEQRLQFVKIPDEPEPVVDIDADPVNLRVAIVDTRTGDTHHLNSWSEPDQHGVLRTTLRTHGQRWTLTLTCAEP